MSAFRTAPVAIALGLGLAVFSSKAAEMARPDYQPERKLSGDMRIVSESSADPLMLAWVEGFKKYHPALTVIDRGTSPLACVPGVASGGYDVGFPARELWSFEEDLYRKARGYDAFIVKVALGAQKATGLTPTLGVYVNASNPVQRITLAQLDAIYSSARRRGLPGEVKTWGDLGATGHWANQPIRAYSHRLPNGIDYFVQKTVTRGASFKKETVELPMRQGTLGPDDVMAQAIAKDPDGIGLGCFGNVIPGMKTIAVAETDKGPFFAGTEAEVRSLQYPLYRSIYLVVDRAPNRPLDPKIAEFLRFILSAQGQQVVEATHTWLPLPAAVAAKQAERIARPEPVPLVGADAAAPGGPSPLLPPYVRRVTARGTVRICGDTQGGLLNRWEKAFVELHPNVSFANVTAPSQLAVPGMILGIADLGIAGAPAESSQIYLLNKMGGSRPVEISIAGGSYDVKGRSAVLAVYVNRANPIDRLTIGQLAGIFGEMRNAGWKDHLWDGAEARGSEENLRRWGQAGLTGDWVGQQIHTYGLSWGGPDIFMTRLLTGDSGKWNPNYRTYNIPGFARGTALVSQMAADMANDPSAIGWTQMIFAAGHPELKMVALAWDERGPYVLPSKETLENRTYPLSRDIYMYARLPLDHPEDEFLRFILSAEGQKIVAEQGIFAPLTLRALEQQLRKLQ